MFTEHLFGKMIDGGYCSRPADKPILSHYNIVEISSFKLHGWQDPEARRANKRPRREPQRQIVRVEGLIKPCTTKGRVRAPVPVSTQDLTHSQFDRGHVIALELGGVDDPHNIVPQCRYWQQSGPWRQEVENTILRSIAKAPDYSHFMIVDVAYGRDPCNPAGFRVTVQDTRTGNVVFSQQIENEFSDNDVYRQDLHIDDEEREIRAREKVARRQAGSGGNDSMELEAADSDPMDLDDVAVSTDIHSSQVVQQRFTNLRGPPT